MTENLHDHIDRAIKEHEERLHSTINKQLLDVSGAIASLNNDHNTSMRYIKDKLDILEPAAQMIQSVTFGRKALIWIAASLAAVATIVSIIWSWAHGLITIGLGRGIGK